MTNEVALVRTKKIRGTLKMIWHRHVLRHVNFLHDIIEGKVMGNATQGKKRMESLQDTMKRRDYRQLASLRQIKMKTG